LFGEVKAGGNKRNRQGNRIKKEEVRAKPAKGSERGLIQPVDQPLNLSFEQISSEMDAQSEFYSVFNKNVATDL